MVQHKLENGGQLRLSHGEKEQYLGVRETQSDRGHHPDSASPMSLLEPTLPLRVGSPMVQPRIFY